MSPSGSVLTLVFNERTDMAGMVTNIASAATCAAVLKDPPAGMACRWTSVTTFDVSPQAALWPSIMHMELLGSEIAIQDGVVCVEQCTSPPSSPVAQGDTPTLSVGRRLQASAYLERAAAAACCASNVRATVTLAKVIPSQRPIAGLTVPQQLSGCAVSLQIDTSGSTSNGVMPLLKQILVDPTTPNAAAFNAALRAAQQLATPQYCTPDHFCDVSLLTVSVDSILLPPGDSVTFMLDVMAWTNVTSVSRANATVTRVSDNSLAPTVLVSAPNEAYRSQRLALQSSLTSPCVGHTLARMNYLWVVPDASPTLVESTRRERTLSIPSGRLPAASTVSVTFHACYNSCDRDNPATSCDIPSCRYSASASINLLSTALVARIAGGSVRLVGVGQPVELNGATSYDPDDVTAVLRYSWACSTASNADCAGVLPTTTAATITIPANSLSPLTWYALTLTVSSDVRTASALVNITTQAINPPSVSISNNNAGATKISASQVLRLVGTSSATAATYAWTIKTDCVAEDGLCCTSGDAPCSGVTDLYCCAASPAPSPALAVLPTSMSQTNLIVPINSLTPGATYTFTLRGYQAAGTPAETFGFSSLSLTINQPPRGGQDSFTVSPLSGEVLSTSFELNANGWVDDADDLPLTYAFFYLDAATTASNWADDELPTSALPLAPASYQTVLTTTVPIRSNDLRLFATAADAYSRAVSTNVSITTTLFVVLETSSDATNAAATVITANLGAALDVGDSGAVQQAVSLAVQLLDESQTLQASEEAQAAGTTTPAQTAAAAEVAAEITVNRTRLRAQLISGLSSSFVAGEETTLTEVASQGALVKAITDETSELDPSSRQVAICHGLPPSMAFHDLL